MFVFFVFFCLKLSPIQNIIFNFCLIADLIFRLIKKLVSPVCLFSECPIITNFDPVSLIILAFIDPV